MSAALNSDDTALAEHGAAPASAAPLLPIEKHAVAVALSAEQLRGFAEQLLLVMRHAPRDDATFFRVMGQALDAWCDADRNYRAYCEVLSCQGQA